MNRNEFFEKIFLQRAPAKNINDISNPSSTLKKYKGKWDTPAITYFLKRTQFGASTKDIEYFKKLSLKKSIAEILIPSNAFSPAPLNNYTDEKIIDAEVPLGTTWINATKFDGMTTGRRRNSYKQWWIGNMINQNYSLSEKMILFWHNHFSTQTEIVGNPVFCYRYNALLRQYALGNFKDLVKAMSVDLCMLRYLNGYANTKKAPDENYGRELQELFTVGKGPDSHYTEADVKAAARVLTGHNINYKTLLSSFNAGQHDTSDKQFSAFYGNTIIIARKGADGEHELDDLVDMILNQEEVSKFICRKLYRFFVFYNIDDATEKNIITPLAKIFRKNNYDIEPVIKTLFSSKHFFDSALRGTMIKSPIDFSVGLVREFGITSPETENYIDNYSLWEFVRGQAAAMQQNVGDPPNVAGWPAYYQQPEYYKLWINSDTLTKRNLFSDRMINNGFVTKSKTKMAIEVIAFAASLPNPQDPVALINDSIQLLYTVDLPSSEKDHIKSNILLSNLQGMEADHYWTNAWNKLAQKPDDLINKKLVTQKLKALYKYLMNRPEYQVI